jgi:hypothetical protein
MHYLNDMILELDDAAQVKYTADGYMKAMPRVARTGIQLYRGSELGRPGKAVVKIYRDENEVFSKDSLATFPGKPFTDDHPPRMVDASNWKRYAVGDAGDEVLRDGEFIRVPMMLRDAAVVRKVKDGKTQLSVGYGCEIDWTPGTSPSGEAYDGRQIGIVVNHIAVVDAARGGKKLAIGDGDQETNHPLYAEDGSAFNDTQTEDTVDMKTMIVDGITCEMSDTAIQVVTRALDAAKGNLENLKKANEEEQKKAKDALDTANAAVAKLTTEAQTKDAEIVTLKKQVADAELTPAKLDALVKDRAVVADKAKSLLSTVVVDGKSVNEIKRQVVDAKLGDAAKSWTDEQVSISFDTLTVGVNVQTNDGVVRTAQAFSGQPTAQTIADRNGRYDNYDKKLGEAWRKPASAA